MTLLSAFKNTFLLLVLLLLACGGPQKKSGNDNIAATSELETHQEANIVIAANNTAAYLPLISGKKIAVVANQTSVIFSTGQEDSPRATHLVDSLLSMGADVKKVFSPEHGFRGRADAGETIEDGVDKQSGLPIISLYGSNKKPTAEQLDGLDLVVFDIQDVGVRFYTYIATLQLVMEACADAGIAVIVLDRPNPNAHYVDGPLMEKEFMGFLGLTPIPLVYGMTIGEYASMIKGEGWLDITAELDLTVIPLVNYDHKKTYELPIRPSPNLPNAQAVNLYPSLGLFEGTNVNAGRGTEFQFQRFGAPFLDEKHFRYHYTPQSNFGAKNPKHKNVTCYGEDLSGSGRLVEMKLQWLITAYSNSRDKEKFFNTSGFSKHAGTAELQKQIAQGMTEAEIKSSWEEDLRDFKLIRAKYLLYD